MKTKAVSWVRGAGAYELLFFMIMLGLAMYWVVNSLMPESGDDKPRLIKRLSIMTAAEENANKMSEARMTEKAAMDEAEGKTEDEQVSK